MIPYKHNLLALALLIVLSQTAFSQVKKQYKDETFAQTTIVVKESKTNATDQEILDAQFDIDDFGMDQVIKITTESDRKKVAATAPVRPEKATTVAEAPVQQATPAVQAAPAPVQSKVKIVKSTEAPVKAQEEKPAAQVRQGSTRTKTKVSSGSRTRSYSKSKKSYKNKRFKKKKRKRAKKGKRYKCYKF